MVELRNVGRRNVGNGLGKVIPTNPTYSLTSTLNSKTSSRRRAIWMMEWEGVGRLIGGEATERSQDRLGEEGRREGERRGDA